MLPWLDCPCLTLDLAQPPARRYAGVPEHAFARGKILLDAIVREIPPKARLLADAVRLRTLNRFQAEATSLADQVGASWRDVMLANISYDLLLASVGCSTVTLATPQGPVVARNMDWWPEHIIAQASYQVLCVRGNELAFINAGWPGAIGVVT